MRESENIKKVLNKLVSKIDFGPADYEVFEVKPGVIQLYVVDTPEDYPYKDIPKEEEGLWDFALNINEAPEIGKYVLTEYPASKDYEKDPNDVYFSYFDSLDDAIEAAEETINGYLPMIHKKANNGYKAYKKYLNLDENRKEGNNKMLLDENLFEDAIQRRPKKNLKEAMWRDRIPDDLAKAFRNAIEQSDDEQMAAVIEPTKAVIEWLMEKYPEEENEFEEMLSDLDTIDAGAYPEDSYSEGWDDDEDNTNEDFFNYILSNLYDECDYLRVWIPTGIEF